MATSTAPRWPVRLTVTSQRGVPVQMHGHTYAPTAGRAFAILDAVATLGASPTDSEGAQRVIDEVLVSILDPRFWSSVRLLAPSNRQAVVMAILAVTAEAPESGQEPKQGEMPRRALPMTRERTLRSAVRLAREYGWTLGEVLALPWPEYVVVARDADALRARDTLDAMSAAHPTKSAIDELVERMRPMTERAARDREATRPPTAWEREGITLDEYRERQLERARALKKQMVLTKQGGDS